MGQGGLRDVRRPIFLVVRMQHSPHGRHGPKSTVEATWLDSRRAFRLRTWVPFLRPRQSLMMVLLTSRNYASEDRHDRGLLGARCIAGRLLPVRRREEARPEQGAARP